MSGPRKIDGETLDRKERRMLVEIIDIPIFRRRNAKKQRVLTWQSEPRGIRIRHRDENIAPREDMRICNRMPLTKLIVLLVRTGAP